MGRIYKITKPNYPFEHKISRYRHLDLPHLDKQKTENHSEHLATLLQALALFLATIKNIKLLYIGQKLENNSIIVNQEIISQIYSPWTDLGQIYTSHYNICQKKKLHQSSSYGKKASSISKLWLMIAKISDKKILHFKCPRNSSKVYKVEKLS